VKYKTSGLKEGKNAIAVRVMSNGMNTYQLVKHTGGFIAWGEIKTPGKTFDLVTPGKWKCKQDKGYDQEAPKMTFAQLSMPSIILTLKIIPKIFVASTILVRKPDG